MNKFHNSLLDNLGCAVIGAFQMDQRHPMLKVSLRAPNKTIYCHKKVCLEQKFLLGPIVWNKVISCFISPLFIMFLYT